MDSEFEWLQHWYKSQCDGDWEHEYGISIETVDNPGWYLTINLSETKYAECTFQSIQVEKDELNWYFCLTRNNNFEASCGPCNLGEVIVVFRNWIESIRIKSS